MKELELEDLRQFFKEQKGVVSRTGIAERAGVPVSMFRKLTSDSEHKGVRYTDRIKTLYTKKVLPVLSNLSINLDQESE